PRHPPSRATAEPAGRDRHRTTTSGSTARTRSEAPDDRDRLRPQPPTGTASPHHLGPRGSPVTPGLTRPPHGTRGLGRSGPGLAVYGPPPQPLTSMGLLALGAHSSRAAWRSPCPAGVAAS